MEWLMQMPIVLWCVSVFVLGLVVGSFLNVLIARLPYEKSIIWPSSRCFACYTRIRLTDNLPIIGYLRLRGKCRHCGAAFSSRYLWVEIGTGAAFLALFAAEVLFNTHAIKANEVNLFAANVVIPPLRFWAMFAYHAVLVSCLIAAAVIDVQHKIIPPLIPYTGVAIGIIGGALMPWPWPNPPAAGVINVEGLQPNAPWAMMQFWGLVPAGVQPWPFWGPTFAFAPPGSIQLGLLNGVIGALAGSLAVRLIKWLFETGFGREALGLGDADLLMMAGAFLGWQIAVMSLFVGAVVAIFLKILAVVVMGSDSPKEASATPADASTPPDPRELPFGPGLAIGVVITWFAWPWLGPRMQFAFFDHVAIGLSLGIMCVGLLAAGLLLRRPEEVKETAKV
jgi:leader peptidase (prepilin peptidase)/N-methyltransferase